MLAVGAAGFLGSYLSSVAEQVGAQVLSEIAASFGATIVGPLSEVAAYWLLKK